MLYVIIAASIVSPPLLIALAFLLLFRFRRTASPWKAQARTASKILLFASAADAALLWSLPLFKLSYGPPGFTWIAFGMARLGLFVCLGLVWLLFQRRYATQPGHPPSEKSLLVYRLAHLALTAVLFYGAYIEPFWLTVSHLPLPGGPTLENGRPLRILHLSDIHIERTTRRERQILQQVKDLQPDLILLTGDYVNLSYLEDPQALADTRNFLTQLHAPLGIFAVNGSVDNTARMQYLFADTEIRVLNNEVFTLDLPHGPVALVGVKLVHQRAQETAALTQLAASIPADTYSILLYHTPDLAEAAASNGIDLYLAGHTHGGQVRVPGYGAVITSSFYGKRFEMGHYQLDGGDGLMNLYVSRGLGMEGSIAPRVRFLSPPEMVVIESGTVSGLETQAGQTFGD